MMVGKLVRRWAIAAIAVPLAGAGVRRLSEAVEARRGPSRTTKLLRRSGEALQWGVGRSSTRARRGRR